MLNIRPAISSDLESIIRISRECFPNSPRWQGPKSLGMIWFKSALAANETEIWVGLFNEQVVCFAVIIIDEIKWAETKRERRGHLFHWLISLLANPKPTISRIREKWFDRFRDEKGAQVHKKHLNIHSRVWLDMIAVSRHLQGKGLGKQMLSVCEKRTINLHRDGLAFNVERENVDVLKFYERCGYTCVAKRKAGCLYVKKLQDNSLQNSASV